MNRREALLENLEYPNAVDRFWPENFHVFFWGGRGVTSSENREIPVHEISFRNIDGIAVTEQQVLKIGLRKLGLYGRQFAYSAFPPAKLQLVLNTGTFHRQNGPRRDIIDCCIVNPDSPGQGIRHDEEYDLVYYMSVARGAEHYTYGVFAVYDMNQLDSGIPEETSSHPVYRFKHPDKKREALLAVVKVINFYSPE